LPEFAAGQSVEKAKIINQRVPFIFENAKSKTRKTLNNLPSNRYPITTDRFGKWKTTAEGGWTSGFFPGILWLLYEQSDNKTFKEEAIKRQNNLSGQQYNTKTHDVGFIIFESFGNGYQLTKNDRYRSIINRTAKSLSLRYNKKVGLIKSWENLNTAHQTIIDNLMNLQILFWSAKNGGGQNLKKIATSHALKTAKDFVRPNGSTYHLVNYNPSTGKIISKMSAQGFSAQSSWARGQAWAIYGFTAAYRETGDVTLLNTAQKTASYFINNLPPDFIPYWDFNAPDKQKAPRDSSAAAIAASGLIELAKIETSQTLKNKYMGAAENILLSLSSPKYLSSKATEGNILLHSTYNKNIGDFDTGTIWGDYYFIEALLKYKALTQK
jgi:unsaturated chondroitin disaccharide hydrolase